MSKDSPAKFSLPGEYVTTGFWRPVLSSETKGEISAVVKKKVVFDLPHVNAGLWADVMVVRRVGTLPVPNLVVLAKLSVRHEMQATLKLEDSSKAMVCDFLVMDIDVEMLGSTLDDALVYRD